MREQDFERLYADEAQGLFAFLAYRTGDRALAEDLLADAFERVLRSKYDKRRGSQKTWLYSIALNALRDHVRRAAAEGRAYARVEVPAGTGPFGHVEDPDELTRALGRLAGEGRVSIALRFGPALT